MQFSKVMKHKEKPKKGGGGKGPILCKKHEKEYLKLVDVSFQENLVPSRA